MDWHKHFQQVFFEQWKIAGFPNPELYTGEYIDAREHHQQPIPFIEADAGQTTGIPYYKLKSVYGFGKVTGELLCKLIGLSKEKTAPISDWCGRFNLGISLFDYICDEMQNKDSVLTLEVFKPLLSPDVVVQQPTHPAEQLLSSIAASVFENIHQLGSTEISTALKRMFDAEHLLAVTSRSVDIDLKLIKEAMYLKSAEPFHVMAHYAALSGGVAAPALSSIHSFGKAVGQCYWLIDDARDLWDDREAGQWNLFLAEDAAFATTTQQELTAILLKLELAEKRSTSAIFTLVEALNEFDADEEAKEKIAGFIGASLWQWFCY